MVYTFYICSDENDKPAADKKRMNAIAAAFSALGHKTVVGKRDSNAHSNPPSACKGKNDVFVCIFSGFDLEVVSDHTGWKQSNWFAKKIKNAHIMYIYWGKACIDVANTKKVSKAHDGKGNVAKSMSNPAAFLKKHNITWIQGRTDNEIVNKIRNKQFEGAGLNFSDSKGGSSTVKENVTTYTITHGFNKSTPFKGYFKIGYTVVDSGGKNKYDDTQYIYVDWSGEAPDGKRKFNNPSAPLWNNNEKNIHEIEVLKHIKSVEDINDNKNYKYYLKTVELVYDFQDIKDDLTTEDEENLVYNDKNDSDYKVNLYDVGVFSGELINPIKLGVSGKSLLDGVKSILDTTKYIFNITYKPHRNDDIISFKQNVDTANPIYTFEEGFNGDIIDISNVKYSPTADLINNAITIYKVYSGDGDEVGTYRYTRKSHLNEVLRYGEQTHIESLSESTGFLDASQRSYDNLVQYFKPDTTLTIGVAGLPPVNVNDYVATKTVNPLLTNEYVVASREIKIDTGDRPMIQTFYGLGDIDYKLKVKNNLANQRRNLVKRPLDINLPVTYKDTMTDELVDNVWV